MKFFHNKGFSIIELMITVLVLSVLMGIAAPAFLNLIKNNRMLSEAYALRATFNNARSEAMTRRTTVTVCRSTDGASCSAGAGTWSEGYIAFADNDNDGVLDPNELFFAKVIDNETLDMTLISAVAQVAFDSRGFARGSSGTIEVCDDRGPEQARGVIISAVGSIRAATDTDSTPDDIANDHLGVNFDCN